VGSRARRDEEQRGQLSWGEVARWPGFCPTSAFGINDRLLVHTPDTSRFAAFLSPLRLRGRRPAAAGRRRSGRRITADLPAAPKRAALRSQVHDPGSPLQRSAKSVAERSGERSRLIGLALRPEFRLKARCPPPRGGARRGGLGKQSSSCGASRLVLSRFEPKCSRGSRKRSAVWNIRWQQESPQPLLQSLPL
jgi:hypothetical protein